MSAPPKSQLRHVLGFSYAQAMLGAIYAASTGGMFLIGYALKLGAGDVQIGLLSSIPMLCVVAQLLSSMLVQHGASRRSVTVWASFANVGLWSLIILIPFVVPIQPPLLRIGVLIAIVTMVNWFGHMAGNARSSWVGDLIPDRYRGRFFGRSGMYSSLIASGFAICEGTFLDHVKDQGLTAFGWLFGFGMLFGLINVFLFLPQPDMPSGHEREKPQFLTHVWASIRNKPLRAVIWYGSVWVMQAIAWPFYATYILRDLKMPFLGLGILNACGQVMAVVSSPFWGKMVDRYGCRPVLIACTCAMAPLPLVWLGMTNLPIVYAVIPALNLFGGFMGGGIGVALSTLLYRVTPRVGRTVQFAVYALVIVIAGAPMPTLGGYLPRIFHTDLRITFACQVVFLTLGSLLAMRLREENCRRARDLVANLPGHLWRSLTWWRRHDEQPGQGLGEPLQHELDGQGGQDKPHQA
jgi:MFS family permease